MDGEQPQQTPLQQQPVQPSQTPPPVPPQTPQTPQTPQPQKSGTSPALWIIVVLLVVVIGIGAWYFLVKSKKTIPTITVPTTTVTPTELSPSPTATATGGGTAAKTGVQVNYDKATSVEPVAGRSTEVNAELMPILKKVFPEGVKLTDASTGWLTYTINRVLTSNDIKSVRAELEAINYTIDSVDEKGISASKGAQSISVEFDNINDKDKAEINVTL
jgi:hypothetical protein